MYLFFFFRYVIGFVVVGVSGFLTCSVSSAIGFPLCLWTKGVGRLSFRRGCDGELCECAVAREIFCLHFACGWAMEWGCWRGP